MKRSAEDCPFYPACYIAGDCGHNDWKANDCGLPKAEQARRAEQWRANLNLRVDRNLLGDRLKAEAQRGDHDHLLASRIEARSDETPKSGSARKGESRKRRPNDTGRVL